MPAIDLSWPELMLCVFAGLLALWVFAARHTRVGMVGRIVGLAHLVVAAAGSAAPIRAALDPSYSTYAFGLLAADSSLTMVVAASAVWIAAVLGAFASLDNSRGGAAIAFATSAVFSLHLGVPLVRQFTGDVIVNLQLGHLVIPVIAAAALLTAVLVIPFAVGVVWAGGRAMERYPA